MRIRKAPWAIALLVGSLAALTVTGCGSEESDTDAECVDNKQFFQKEVWSEFMGTGCTSCHMAGGSGDQTKLVLQPEAQTGFLDANMAILRDVAGYQKNGTSILLSKPAMMDIDHVGGKIFEKDSKEYKALVEMIQRFDEPVTCGGDTQVDEHFSAVELLSPNETFRKATLNLAGRLPTAAEDFRISTGGEEALDQELDNLLHEAGFYQRLEGILNDMFLTDRYLGRSEALDLLDPDYYPDVNWFDENDDNRDALARENQEFLEKARDTTNDAMARELLHLATYIVKNDRPFTEIVTADYMVMNPFTARAYGVTDITFENPLDENEWKEGRIPNTPHSGVLTSPMYLNRFPTTATNRNRHRSRMIYWFFLATDVMKLAERPIDTTDDTTFNPTRENPNCNVCHNIVDPIAGAMMNWNEQGSYQIPEDGWYPEMYSPGIEDVEMPYGGQELEATRWLGNRIATDRRFATAMVHHMYRGLTGQTPLLFPSNTDSETYQHEVVQYEVQDKTFDVIAQKFIDSDYNLRTIFKELIASKYFRAANFQDTEGVTAEVTELGMGRMLTPELLDAKIEAVTGMPWADRDGDRYLLEENEYRLLYGGIDSDDVIRRMTDPNGIMAGIQLRMANEVACTVTARDFTQTPQKRRLFPMVEFDTAPLDEAGFPDLEAEAKIRKNIAHLHYHILGERLETTDEEVTRTFNLFLETLQEGRLKLNSEELDASLLCRATTNFDGVELPEEERITRDESYTIRSWQAVVTYLLADYKFLYE